MQIGFVRKEEMKIKDGVVGWLECYFRIAGIRPFSAKLSVNKNKTDNQPDYYIYLRGNVNKGDSFRDIPIGSLWLGEKVIDGELKKFMTGSIELAFKKIAIAVWRAEPRYEGEVINYIYDIKTMEEKPKENSSYSYQEENDIQQYSAEIKTDEIPF